ncbi:MAG TPA: hypothetical protein V6D03_15110 [Candidatus Caenarcaniphilales bacterium]|uniref:Uncharacterized protein n=1 Tax=uncultured Synechococcales cyanobacterium TaxID=1936017 RepID=A0A6J4VY57_9CYAN|nr:hypothetical protein AVDCRST_MAG81-4970 [uncultured Synechococcales cyanobacterium]
MEPWQKDFLQMIEGITSEAEQFLDGVLEVVEEIATDIDQLLTEAIVPVVEICLGLETVVGDATQPIIQTVQPMIEEHSACIGCRHYYGQVHGDNLLICAMHPYGWDEDACPDWQSTWPEKH